jgi:hypothetical protein
MSGRVLTIITLCGAALAGWIILGQARGGAYRLPGNDMGYEPVQPIAFSHLLHAGELAIDCFYCHSGAEQSRVAGLPPAESCMNCHRFVTTTWGAVRAEDQAARDEKRDKRSIVSPELAKLYDALGLGPDLKRDPSRPVTPVQWLKVHDLPDFVAFDHSRHVNAGVSCQHCHGPVETMERVRQVQSLSMGWCVTCHRDVNAAGVPAAPTGSTVRNTMPGQAIQASTDCAGCHY